MIELESISRILLQATVSGLKESREDPQEESYKGGYDHDGDY